MSGRSSTSLLKIAFKRTATKVTTQKKKGKFQRQTVWTTKQQIDKHRPEKQQ